MFDREREIQSAVRFFKSKVVYRHTCSMNPLIKKFKSLYQRHFYGAERMPPLVNTAL